VRAVKLWTGETGVGYRLYKKGFYVVNSPGPGFEWVLQKSRYTPWMDEIRMRLDINDLDV